MSSALSTNTGWRRTRPSGSMIPSVSCSWTSIGMTGRLQRSTNDFLDVALQFEQGVGVIDNRLDRGDHVLAILGGALVGEHGIEVVAVVDQPLQELLRRAGELVVARPRRRYGRL